MRQVGRGQWLLGHGLGLGLAVFSLGCAQGSAGPGSGQVPEAGVMADAGMMSDSGMMADAGLMSDQCEADERVEGGACVPCTAGTTNAQGDDPSGLDTSCDSVDCPAGSMGMDVAAGCTCGPGTTGTIAASTASPYYTGSCTPILCAADEYEG